ncbi:MAG: 16S rRNA (uracil(1498)-N(3))-methyltransferase [Anaerolineaceae bacterium]
MNRFFLPQAAFQGNTVHFSEEISRQIVQVLRLKPDSYVIVLNGLGKLYRVRLTDLSAQATEGEIESEGDAEGEPQTQLTLYLCLTQREKFEWMLQKCTEIGASRFVPVVSSRSLVQKGEEALNKYERWQKILREAAEQSHRGIIPVLEAPMQFQDALKFATKSDACNLIPWEEEKSVSLRSALRVHIADEIGVLIGPEGGFSKEEVALAQAANFIPVTLGKRILRMETAAIVASALVLYERGEMGD